MYRINYYEEEKTKDVTYDEAFYSSMDHGNHKWEQYYGYLREKYDLCYNVESITIDTEDIEKMQLECFSNDILLKLYLKCIKENLLVKYDQLVIPNNSLFSEELIYNILKTEWLIDESLLENDQDELKRRKNYFKAIIEASETRPDIKVQFRNKLFEYFIKKYDSLRDSKKRENEIKVLRLEKQLNK